VENSPDRCSLRLLYYKRLRSGLSSPGEIYLTVVNMNLERLKVEFIVIRGHRSDNNRPVYTLLTSVRKREKCLPDERHYLLGTLIIRPANRMPIG
jgi:hypothetical protein